MSIKITNNMAQIVNERNNSLALAFRLMLDDIHRHSLPSTPKRRGNLRADVIKEVNGLKATITWDKNYAAYQEAGITHGTTMRKYTTPGTGPHFAKRAVAHVVSNSDVYLKRVGL